MVFHLGLDQRRLKPSESLYPLVIRECLEYEPDLLSEAQQAIKDGALEIDTVIPLGLLLSQPPRYQELFQHLRTIISAADPVPVKVIIETGLIPTPELKIAACVLAAEAGAAFVKTSTGFAAGGGATKEDVQLMYRTVKYKGSVKVKASGGVRSFEACKEMFAAGAERIGTYVPIEFGRHIMANADCLRFRSSSGAAIVANAAGSAGSY